MKCNILVKGNILLYFTVTNYNTKLTAKPCSDDPRSLHFEFPALLFAGYLMISLLLPTPWTDES